MSEPEQPRPTQPLSTQPVSTPSPSNEPVPEQSPQAHSVQTHPLALAQYGLLALALLYTLYFAKTLLIPFVVAWLFALLFSPLVSLLKRFHVPRTLSAILILAVIGGPFTLLGIQLVEPTEKWVKLLPELSVKLTAQLDAISDAWAPEVKSPVATPPPKPKAEGFNFFGWFDDDETENLPPQIVEPLKENPVSERMVQGGLEVIVSMLGATPALIAQLMTFIIMLIFILVYGPQLFTTFVNVFPQVKNKRAAVLLVGEMQKELSRYILTVSVINTGLGIITGTALWILGVEDALLWGVLVGLLNFAPYVGPILSIIILGLAGVVQYGPVLEAFLPALIFFSINLLEAQLITPLILGRKMRLNPLMLMAWLVVWGWLWGAMGVLLAVPLLVCIKLIAGRLSVMDHWVKLIESRT